MNQPEFIGVSEALTSLNQTDMKNMVFWLGAGIDARPPTCLPLGDDLRKKLLELAIGSDLSNKLNNEWKRIFTRLEETLGTRVSLSSNQRLETIIDCIKAYEEKVASKKISIINSLSCFENIEYSYNHLVLAQYLIKGSNIVTTNYEKCIINAYQDILGPDHFMECEYEDNDSSVYIFKGSAVGSGLLIYLHGIATDPKKIGITLTSLKNGLGKRFDTIFREWLNSDMSILYLGYSGLDSLDVTPFLKTCGVMNNSTAYYIRHSMSDIEESELRELSVTLNENNLLNPCKKKYICPCNTDKLFERLGSRLGVALDSDGARNKEWIRLLEDTASNSAELYYTLLAHIMFILNLNSSEIFSEQDYNKAERTDLVSKPYVYYYCFRVAHLQGERDRMKYYAQKYYDGALPNILLCKSQIKDQKGADIARDYYAALGQVFNLRILNSNPSRIAHNIINVADKEQISWTHSSQLNRYLSFIISLVSKFPIVTSVFIRLSRKELNQLIESLDKTVSGGYRTVKSVNQYNTALRTLGLAKNMIGDGEFHANQKNIEEALQNYADTSSLHGITVTLIYSSYSYCFGFLRSKEATLRTNAILDLNLAAKAIMIVDDKAAMSRLEFAKKFIEHKTTHRFSWRVQNQKVSWDN